MTTNPLHPSGRRLVQAAAAALLCLLCAIAAAAPATAQAPDTAAPGATDPVLLPFAARSHLALQPEPANGAAGVSPNAWLAWQTTLPPAVAATYRWTILLDAGATSPTTPIASTLARAWYDPATFTPGATYSWRVVGTPLDATSAFDRALLGPVWRFSVESGARPTTDAELASMVTIPAGEYQMGCDPLNTGGFNCRAREIPLHTVWIDSFAIDKYEVTTRQYQACVVAGACQPPAFVKSQHEAFYYGNPAFDFYPVLFVSWWNAGEYCAWAGKRLPTEAEWEKAARGPGDTRPWPWGSEIVDCTRANFTDDTADDFRACMDDPAWVGSYARGASPYGVMDMAGNVFEWVHDKYNVDYYAVSPYLNPPGPESATASGDWFVMRGGSYRPRWWYPRTFNRHFGHHGDEPYGDAPLFRNDQAGFRCAVSN